MKNFLFLIFMIFMAGSTVAKEQFDNSVLKGQVDHALIGKYKQFNNFQYDLMYLAAHAEKNNQANHFCLVGYRWPNATVRVVVYWKEDQTLYIWSGRRIVPEAYGDYASDLMMTDSIDLRNNIVDREDQMGMSTYLRRDVEGTLEDCARHGIHYELKPFTPPPEKSEDDW